MKARLNTFVSVLNTPFASPAERAQFPVTRFVGRGLQTKETDPATQSLLSAFGLVLAVSGKA